jgi:hypothetical protein
VSMSGKVAVKSAIVEEFMASNLQSGSRPAGRLP